MKIKSMKTRCALLGLLIAACAGSAPAAWPDEHRPDGIEEYFFGMERVEFARFENAGLLVTKSCLTGGRLGCQAAAALGRAHAVGATRLGANPGALICRRLGGEVLIGVDERRNELAFCWFQDESMVSCGSLAHRAL